MFIVDKNLPSGLNEVRLSTMLHFWGEPYEKKPLSYNVPRVSDTAKRRAYSFVLQSVPVKQAISLTTISRTQAKRPKGAPRLPVVGRSVTANGLNPVFYHHELYYILHRFYVAVCFRIKTKDFQSEQISIIARDQ